MTILNHAEQKQVQAGSVALAIFSLAGTTVIITGLIFITTSMVKKIAYGWEINK